MRKSYIDSNSGTQSNDLYQQSSSYVAERNNQYSAQSYAILPEEYSIFSEIDNSYFVRNETDQYRLLGLCLQRLKTQLLNIYAKYGIIRVLPKLSITSDEDDAIILNWAYANFRIYFNFEKVIDSSYYGIVAQNTEETIFTNAGKLSETNYTTVIDMILTYVIDNS